jgi:hypothetical protein
VGDFSRDRGGSISYHPALVVARGRGAFIRPHVRAREQFFVDGSGKVLHYTPPVYPKSGPLGEAAQVFEDAAVVGGEIVDLGFYAQDNPVRFTTVVAAKRAPDGSFGFHADALLPMKGVDHALTKWSSAAQIGFFTMAVDAPRAPSWAHFIALRPDGTFAPAEPVATLPDLGPRPRPCTADDRARLPRIAFRATVESALVFEGRWPVITVTEALGKGGAMDPVTLGGSAVVLFGSPRNACLGAWEALGQESGMYGAIVGPDLAHSWFFRLVAAAGNPSAAPGDPSSGPVGAVLEARPMSCRDEAPR